MTAEERYDLIIRFSEGTLSESEKAQFEELLHTDSKLAEEVKFQEFLNELIKEKEGINLKNRLEKLHTEATAPSSKPSFRFGKVQRIAAAVILAAGLGASLYFFVFNPQQDNQTLFAEYFEASVWEGVRVRFDGPSQYDRFESAAKDYINKDFQTAAEKLEQFEETHPKYIESQFYLGNCYLALNQSGKAIAVFQEITEQDDLLYGREARWYLALSYLASDNVEEAKKHLEQLSKLEGGPHPKKAKELLQELD